MLYTDRARKIIALANQEARRFDHEHIDTEHILLGLVKEGSGVGARVLRDDFDIDLRKIRLRVEQLVKSGERDIRACKLPRTPRVDAVLQYAGEESRNLNHSYVGSEHLLLGLIREQNGIAAQVLANLGVSLENTRIKIIDRLTKQKEVDASLKQQQGEEKDNPVSSFDNNEKETALMIVIEKISAIIQEVPISLRKANDLDQVFRLGETAKKIYRAKDEKDLQSALAEL